MTELKRCPAKKKQSKHGTGGLTMLDYEKIEQYLILLQGKNETRKSFRRKQKWILYSGNM